MTKTYTNHKGIKAALSNPPIKGQSEFKDSTVPGLYFRVYSTGQAVFIHRYKIKGKQRVYTLPDSELKQTSTEKQIAGVLAMTRFAHAEQKMQLKQGIDPAIERDLQAQEIAAMPTVKQFAETYIEMYAKQEKKSWQSDKRYLDVDVVPALGSLALDTVKKSHVVALLDKKQKAGLMTTRNRLISLLSKFFNFAIERGHIELNPASGIRRTKETSKERVLSDDEILFLWDQTGENSKLSPTNQLAIRMILITGQRPGEVCQLHESQIRDGVWYMTASETKNGQAHSVPLSAMALQIIEDTKLHRCNGLLFPNSKGAIMHNSVLPKAMKRLDWPDLPATPHDLRRTFTTGISQLGFNRIVQDKVTNHKDRGISAIYDRHDYMKEKRQALDAWSRKLSEVLTGQPDSNVVQLRSA